MNMQAGDEAELRLFLITEGSIGTADPIWVPCKLITYSEQIGYRVQLSDGQRIKLKKKHHLRPKGQSNDQNQTGSGESDTDARQPLLPGISKESADRWQDWHPGDVQSHRSDES